MASDLKSERGLWERSREMSAGIDERERIVNVGVLSEIAERHQGKFLILPGK